MDVSRFAPSTTGRAHPGTLLSALLCWLDARARGARVVLRLENLDPQRSRGDLTSAMVEDLAWLGLDWDAVTTQSDSAAAHARGLDRLAADGLLYPCTCSRAQIREQGRPSPDGGFRYPGTCRERELPDAESGGWRAVESTLRVRLPEGPEGEVSLRDESGADLSQRPVESFGDPVVRRRDGAAAYHLASVIDDAEAGVTRVVRGRDLADSTGTQVLLQRLLDLPRPSYRHHLLLLERSGEKLAKLHGSVSLEDLEVVYDARALCGVLAHAAGLVDAPGPTTPALLAASFDWSRVREDDRLLLWDGAALACHA